MAALTNAHEMTAEMRRVRQARQYRPDPVPDEIVDELLEIARWTGSARNTQPWHFIVITDKEQLRQISALRTPINWVAAAPLAIAIVLNGASGTSEAYDEGRVSERLFIGARPGAGRRHRLVPRRGAAAAGQGDPRHPAGAGRALGGRPRLPDDDQRPAPEPRRERAQAAVRDRQLWADGRRVKAPGSRGLTPPDTDRVSRGTSARSSGRGSGCGSPPSPHARRRARGCWRGGRGCSSGHGAPSADPARRRGFRPPRGR